MLYGGRMAQYLALSPVARRGRRRCYRPWRAGFSTQLRAAQNSQHQLLAGVAGTATGIVAALLLLKRHGLQGAIWSMILANAASTLSILATDLWMIRRQRASWAHAFHYFRLDF